MAGNSRLRLSAVNARAGFLAREKRFRPSQARLEAQGAGRFLRHRDAKAEVSGPGAGSDGRQGADGDGLGESVARFH